MTKNLLKTPRFWLNLEICENIFESFKQRLGKREPLPPFDTRFPGKLESILSSVRQTWDGDFLNPTVRDAAAAYLNQLIRGHAFKNGNKRLGVLFTHVFLIENDVDFRLSAEDLYNFAILIAKAGEDEISSDETKKWCKEILGEFTVDISKT